MSDYPKFGSIPRLNRGFVVTEKLDGTNGLVKVDDDGHVYAGSRNRWLTVDDDNFGFARWVSDNAGTLATDLGPGLHYGEWYGQGIQRRYGLDYKAFALFNVARWEAHKFATPHLEVVTVLGEGETVLELADCVEYCLEELATHGSIHVPSFLDPEGIVVWHTAARQLFKATIENDHLPKSVV